MKYQLKKPKIVIAPKMTLACVTSNEQVTDKKSSQTDEVEIGSSSREEEGRNHDLKRISRMNREVDWSTHRHNKTVEQDDNKIINFSKTTKEEIGGLEVIWCHSKPQKRDQAICCNRRDSTSRNKGGEGDLTWEDGAQCCGTEDKDHCNCMLWLTAIINLAYPTGHW